MAQRIPVSVLGATGVVGQRFVRRLADHPRFTIEHLAASPRSAGKAYRDACVWRLDGHPYGQLGDRKLVPATPEVVTSPIVFSALDSGPARELEPRFAAAGAMVFSNASTFRMDPAVPLLVPEVNGEHLAMVAPDRRGPGQGAIVCNPNCTSAILATALAPLHRRFGVEAVHLVSMQAISGAGYPGVSAMDILGNVVPYIAKEEEKVEEEAAKMLGLWSGTVLTPAAIRVSAACHRVPVHEGHSMAVSVRLTGEPSPEAVTEALATYRAAPQEHRLPSAPERPIHVHDDPMRPQVLRDVEAESGMAVQVGRIRRCPHFGIKFFLLGHNTERGAAGGSVLNAELALAMGILS